MADLFDEPPMARNDWNHPDARYVYKDEAGAVLYEVRRLGFGHGKLIRPFSRVNGHWEMGLPEGRVLYRMGEVLAAVAANEPVMVVEGERDADVAHALNYTATTVVGGAKKWNRPEYNTALVGAHVIVVADKDEPGRAHARQVVAALKGVVASIVVVESASGNDLADHVAAGYSIEEDLVLCDPYSPVNPPEEPKASTNGHRPATKDGWPVLDPLALHGVLGDAVMAVAPHSEADPAAVLMTLLCLSGISIGPGPRVYAGLTGMPARLQVWIVGNSAMGRKGASLDLAYKIMLLADEEFMTSRVLGGFGSGEAIIDEVAESGDVRLVYKATEGAGLLAVMSRKGDTTSVVLRQSYDEDALAVRSRVKKATAPMSHIGLLAHITPSDLVGGLTETQIRNGFANRGLFVMSRRPHLLSRGTESLPREATEAGTALGRAIRRARPLGTMRFDEATGARWDDVYATFGVGAPTPLLEDLEARGDVHTRRLAMLFALLDGSNLIGTEHLDAALAVWDYCRASARYLFGAEGAVDNARELNAVQRDRKHFEDDLTALDNALTRCGRLSRTEQRAVFSNNRSAHYVGLLRKELVSRGQAVEQANSSTGGAPRRDLVAVEE